MVAPQARKKEDITEILNRILDQAVRTRQGFTPDVIAQFEQEGSRNREERARQQVREATPVRRPEPARREEQVPVRPEVRKEAIEEAVRVGEMMELAVSGRRPRGEWATS